MKAVEFGDKSMGLDDLLSLTHSLFGAIHLLKKDYEQAIAFTQKGVELDPNDAIRKALLAFTLTYSGRPNEAVALLEKAIRLNPYYHSW